MATATGASDGKGKRFNRSARVRGGKSKAYNRRRQTENFNIANNENVANQINSVQQDFQNYVVRQMNLMQEGYITAAEYDRRYVAEQNNMERKIKELKKKYIF